MNAEMNACFERMKKQAALPGMEEAEVPETEPEAKKGARAVTTGEIVQEKLDVMNILNKWLINAKVHNKHEAASDCGKIIRFINKVCAW